MFEQIFRCVLPENRESRLGVEVCERRSFSVRRSMWISLKIGCTFSAVFDCIRKFSTCA